jgi:hypothetical protein
LRSVSQSRSTKEQLDKALKIDELLTTAGLQPYLQIGKTLRLKLGASVPGSSGGSSGGRKRSARGGSRSKKGKYDYGNILGFGGSTSPISLTDKLLALMNSTTKV